MIPDPDTITVEQAGDTVLFPRDDALNQLFPLKHGSLEFDYFAGMWELPDRKRQNYVFVAPGLLNLLHILKKQGLVGGIQADFGCSPWPATNIWLEDSINDSLPDEAKYALSETYWEEKYASVFHEIRTVQNSFSIRNGNITRVLVDYHFMVHQLAGELPDQPVTAEMELKSFNNEKDVFHCSTHSPHDPSCLGYRIGGDPETVARCRKLNKLSFESARRRATERDGSVRDAGQPFISGATLSCLLNYLPWRAFLKKLDGHLLPGGLLVVCNAEQGWKEHLDWMNMAKDQETIADFIQNDLGYDLRIYELRKSGKPKNQLYLVAQKA